MFLLLLLIGFVAGIVTALLPCVLPVLPILLAGGASGRKPWRIIVGLVASFSVFTLFATWLLNKLGLPDDLLRNLAIALLFVLAATLLVPQLAQLIERPLAVFSRLRPQRVGGGFGLGIALGLVFVPCAGPVLAAVTGEAAREQFGWRIVVLTLVYAVGAAIPMLLIAYGGAAASTQLRAHAESVRTASGVLIAAVAIGLIFHVDDRLAQWTPGYASALQKLETSKSAERELAKLSGNKAPLKAKPAQAAGDLPSYGVAPTFQAGGDWINSPPLTMQGLRGKVVLVDFWTYSCINCLRTLPHLKAWYAAYHDKGLVIVGVHTPEFAFEHVSSNVKAAVKRLGITYPVVQDNNYKTWDAYANQYWPAEYLVDKSGVIRHVEFGEGKYGDTEQLIRQLLGVGGAKAQAVADTTPTELMTPETYLGYQRIDRYAGSALKPDKLASYTLPATLPEDDIAYGGQWKVGAQTVVAGAGATLKLHFQAKNVYIVLGGKGTVQASIPGQPTTTLNVNSYRLYTVHSSSTETDATLELRFSPGVKAYSFTFG